MVLLRVFNTLAEILMNSIQESNGNESDFCFDLFDSTFMSLLSPLIQISVTLFHFCCYHCNNTNPFARLSAIFLATMKSLFFSVESELMRMFVKFNSHLSDTKLH